PREDRACGEGLHHDDAGRRGEARLQHLCAPARPDGRGATDPLSRYKPGQEEMPMTWEKELAELEQRKAFARKLGGAEKVARQHNEGRLTVRERIERLLDPGSFREIGTIAGRAEYDENGDLVD